MMSIPSLSLRAFQQAETRQQFVQDLGQAYSDVGFVALTDHGLSDRLQTELYAAVQAFFALPSEVKLQYERLELAGQRGYTRPGQEHAKDNPVGDLKEFYHVGQPDAPPDEAYPENVFPAELPDFERTALAAYRQLEATGREVLKALALFLDLPEAYFEPHVLGGNSILRPIHYYPILNPDALPEGAVRAGAHEDINLITLLMGASAEGLEILSREGQWVPVTALPNALVVNVGDMLQRLTNNRLRSTTHRVVNPPREKMGSSRYSIPFFLHPRSSMSLACLPSCIDAENPKAYADVTAGEYLNERLREIGLLSPSNRPS